ncbi:MAG: 4-hydroxyphenylpyruvate dioxygenase [Leptolyngbyaceae cyanobacterium SL_1_1]|nr:4-hydroxyphenylpyruvate dioxygenase [Leptolyngbyaceae cyanobacterium RM1_1_2]NJO09378.1 4-hydroxyphenylpyruvate dioxygenase [Leptolyngbyaceae cyanobacterium SL_1_1]
MDICYLHFYIENAIAWRQWFSERLRFQAVASQSDYATQTEVLQNGGVRVVLSSPQTSASPVAHYLQQHPPGVAGIAFWVQQLETVVAQALAAGSQLLQPITTDPQRPDLRWCQIQGWGHLQHTLIESSRESRAELVPVPLLSAESHWQFLRRYGQTSPAQDFLAIDHVVLNVAAGQLAQAADWYESALGFSRKQMFSIQTAYSGLCSQVMVHPQGTAQMPINEPTSSNSQIQEFLNYNQGAGIQHAALRTADIVQAVSTFRQRGVRFISVPLTYYQQLAQRFDAVPVVIDEQAIARQQILVDWSPTYPQALLLQTFTEPIFAEPTFFFEIIERQPYEVAGQQRLVEGFGEGNFQALFEAIEREQQKRGSL